VFEADTVILAAGQGKRLRSSVPKPLVKIKGKTMIEHVIEKAFYATESRKAILVINPDFEGDFLYQLKVPVTFAYQSVPKGTADALAQALNLIENGEDILVMYADLVLISRDSLKSLVSLHIERNCDITFLSGTTERRYPYALVERDERGKL
jgi:bifunctional N-acetylglucosamine-1-phosphate-uridyltransferase/glucosamine-1-phosphate-acetyltransferase GlmU-like protein